MCRLTERLASRHEPFVVGNIMKGRFTPGNPHEPSRARHLIDHVPLHRGLQQHVQHRQHVLTVFGAFATSRDFRRAASSEAIASRRLAPKAGIKCTRSTASLPAIPLGLW